MRIFLKHSLPEILSDEAVSVNTGELHRLAQRNPLSLKSCLNLFAYTPPDGCPDQSVQLVDRAEEKQRAETCYVRIEAYSQGADFLPRDPLP